MDSCFGLVIPQVVQPLRGAHDFKETGRYMAGVATGADKLGVRMAAFPFIGEVYSLHLRRRVLL